jgi:hypothetical protein
VRPDAARVDSANATDFNGLTFFQPVLGVLHQPAFLFLERDACSSNKSLTPLAVNSSLKPQNNFMAENIPNMPGGAVPPKPGEAAKVQPKKETVRINLPPKPTAAPTVRLPTPASGGVSAPAAATAAPVAIAAAAGTAAAVAAAPAPAAKAPTAVQRAVSSSSAPAAPTVSAYRPGTATAVSGLDKALVVAAAVFGLASAIWVIILSMN